MASDMSCPCSDCSEMSVSAGQCLQGRSSPSATLTSWCRPLPDRRRSSRPSTSPVSAPGAARLSLTVWGSPAGQPVVQTHLGRRGELGPLIWLHLPLCDCRNDCAAVTRLLSLPPPHNQMVLQLRSEILQHVASCRHCRQTAGLELTKIRQSLLWTCLDLETLQLYKW